MRSQIREAELIEANRIKSLFPIKWLGTFEEPKKLFFTLLKAKQLREVMNLLITDQGIQIDDEDNILQEVACFYTKRFCFIGELDTTEQARIKILRYTTMTVTMEQRAFIDAIPTSEEIRINYSNLM